MQKYGFVYVWYDRKRKLYYIGSHWGTETDGYICSSNRMRNVYSRRPEDFKRRVVSRIYTNRIDLYNEEQRFFDMVDPKQLATKYYNLTLNVLPRKIENLTGWKHKEGAKTKIGRPAGWKHTEETKEKMRAARALQVFSEESIKKRGESIKKYNETLTPEEKQAKIQKRVDASLEWLSNPENMKIHVERSRKNTNRLISEGKIPTMRGKTHSEETKRKISETRNEYNKTHILKPVSEETRKKLSDAAKGKKYAPMSDETKRKISETKKAQSIRRPHSDETKRKMSETRYRINLNKTSQNIDSSGAA